MFLSHLPCLTSPDSGNAEGCAKNLAQQAKQRKFDASLSALDDYQFTRLPNESLVVVVCSTAGQGEFPQNGMLWLIFIQGY